MKTIEINLYKFDELSEESKQHAIEKLWDINVDYGWWNWTYEDAKNIGLKITGFDIDRGNYCEGEIITSHTELAECILKNHGEQCETYQTAQNFLNERDNLVYKYSDKINCEVVTEENEYDFDQECDCLEDEFLKNILEDYRVMLSDEYDFLTKEDAIIETIKSNDYDFTEDGNIY